MDQNGADSDEQQMDISDCLIYKNSSGKAECRAIAKPCHMARYYRRIKLCLHPSAKSFPELSE
ncbi:MAG: hypothetical protein HY846_08390 [Nitrosomonadales bacterium]|nr:hypothetical protein [Nitrosomonadales bacterium]